MPELAGTSVLLAGAAYLAASINVPIVLCRIGWIPDPRRSHSRNPGVSNVYRTAGPAWATVVLLLDLGRASGIALVAAICVAVDWGPAVGVGLILGNRWPVFHGWRGGKGVANYLGFTLPLAPWAAASAAVSWVLVYWLTRKAFLGSFAMVLVLGGGTIWAIGVAPPAVVAVILSVALVVTAHRTNVAAWLSRTRGVPALQRVSGGCAEQALGGDEGRAAPDALHEARED